MNNLLCYDIDYKNKNIVALDTKNNVTYYDLETQAQLKYHMNSLNISLYNIILINQGLNFVTISGPKSFTLWNLQK